MKQAVIFLLLYLLSVNVKAQVSAGGVPVSFGKVYLDGSVPTVAMPSFDIARLMAEDETRNVKGQSFRFGKDIDVQLNLTNSGIWETLKNGDRVWRLGLKSAGAFSINLIFSEFYMPEGAKMFVYNADKSMVIGAFTAFNNKDHGKFSTDVVKGDHIFIEYYEPAAVRGQGKIAVSKVIHAYRNIFFKERDGEDRGFGDSGSCNNNVNCPLSAGWDNQVNATCMYLLANGTEVCSGSILNNVRQDGTPYFLSANHCYSGDYATWVFRFNYQSANCTPSQNGPTNMSVSGAILKARRADSDFMLFELSVVPPLSYNVYYAGWSNVDVAPTSSVGIHHPAGDVKKFSTDNDASTSDSYGSGTNTHWRVLDWDQGTTEGGSSGSPLFDQNKRVVGQLHGGSAACGNNLSDYYGKFARSWNGSSSTSRLKDWLDPDNTGATVLDGTTFNTPTAQLDAELLEVSGIEPYSCNNAIAPSFRFQNRGANIITSLTYRVSFASGIWDTLTWSGSLAFGTSATVALPTATLGAGVYSYQVEVLLVNGSPDQNGNNNLASLAFEIVSGRPIRIELRTDFYGDETTVQIRDSLNNVIWEQDGFSSFTTYNLTPCLALGCYTFTILDSEGDGICCSYGTGYYRVYDADGTQLFQGGQFGNAQSNNICVTSSAPPVALASPVNTEICLGGAVAFANLSTGGFSSVAWEFPGGTPSTSTSSNPTITYSNLGVYDVKLTVTGPAGIDSIILANAVQVRDLPVFTVNTTNTTVAGGNDGTATVAIGGFGPFTYNWSNGDTAATATGLAAGTYAVTVADNLGCTASQTVTINDGTVGVNALGNELGVAIFPNPANSEVTIALPIDMPATIHVYDQLGKLVYEVQGLFASQRMDVAHWSSGLYTIRTVTPQGMVVSKLVVGK